MGTGVGIVEWGRRLCRETHLLNIYCIFVCLVYYISYYYVARKSRTYDFCYNDQETLQIHGHKARALIHTGNQETRPPKVRKSGIRKNRKQTRENNKNKRGEDRTRQDKRNVKDGMGKEHQNTKKTKPKQRRVPEEKLQTERQKKRKRKCAHNRDPLYPVPCLSHLWPETRMVLCPCPLQ